MNNTHVYDLDLNPVLEKASNEELGVIHDIVVQKMSEMLSIEPVYKQHYPDHAHYADLLAKEVRDFGGNTFVNMFRGEGPTYHEVVCDVAEALRAPFSRDQDITVIESSIMATILARALEEMTDEEKRAVLDATGRANKAFLGPAAVTVLQSIFRSGGFASYQLMLIVVNGVLKQTIGRGLSFAANAALTKAMSALVGPIGLAVSILLTLAQIAGPSFKVTIPCVVYVAMLRAGQRAVKCNECGALLDDSLKFCSECGASLADTRESGENEQEM